MPRLRLKTKLVLAMTAMVVALVGVLSWIYISQLMRQRIRETYQSADFIAHEVLSGARQALEIDLESTKIDLTDPKQVRAAVADILQSDPGLNSLLQSVIGYSPTIYDVSIVDEQGRAMMHTDASLIDKEMPNRRDLSELRDGSFREQIDAVYGNPRVYDVRLPIQLRSGAPFGEIRVGVSTVFLKSELQPQLNRALIFSGILILVSLLLAAGLSNIALRPLEAIGRRLDAMTGGPEHAAEHEVAAGSDEFGAVNTKIDRLGRQIRDVKEVFSALKENLDQIMGTLQDGLILFTKDARIVLVSASAERFVGKQRGDILGETVEGVFNDSTRLGQIVLDAFALRQAVPQREIELDRGRRIQLSLDFIAEGGEQLGALLTMRDSDSVRRIENEIELSRRLAAIGRLTSGVAHEVKNPINSIVVHLEVLREKLLQLDPETKRHMDVIGSEIHRLDRVVKTLVDFTRPVELKLSEVDLRQIVDDVVALAAPEAERQGVNISAVLDAEPLTARVDGDLIKQALLNVVLNGVQAMPQGGPLNVTADRVGETARIVIEDHGEGIPPEVRDKIYNLYFTTKKSGSGIGLAMTYRVMQLHNGALDFDSEPGHGTTFRMLLPISDGYMLEAPKFTEIGRSSQS
ncbi:MAG: ATP-binding protein [Terriglobia bacterium]|nr:ATP-binding protein [Terriglobia bacterium]